MKNEIDFESKRYLLKSINKLSRFTQETTLSKR